MGLYERLALVVGGNNIEKLKQKKIVFCYIIMMVIL